MKLEEKCIRRRGYEARQDEDGNVSVINEKRISRRNDGSVYRTRTREQMSYEDLQTLIDRIERREII